MAVTHHHFLGWDHDRYPAARQEMLTSKRYCIVRPGMETPPRAISLSGYNHRWMEQLQAGTCWLHAAVFLVELLGKANGYDVFDICRMLVGWIGKQIEGGGNPSNGGTVTDALRAMTSEKGGIAHESLYPYTDDFGTLGRKPPQPVFDDATKAHVSLPVDVRSDLDAKVLIASRKPVGIGTWWPFNFDDKQTFMTDIGNGTYGHALTKHGYVEKDVFPGEEGRYAWWQWKNWHGQLYPPLPPKHAECVPGYKPDHEDKTSDFWVREDLDQRLQKMGNYEQVSATDLDGIGKVVDVASFEEAFF